MFYVYFDTRDTKNERKKKMKINWGDMGDGTYRNPVLMADYSDPDLIVVGDDFYLIASDFHYIGMQILHSGDLVNWEIIGQVFNRLPISPLYDTLERYGRGIWAPSLRYHNGYFWIYVCTPDEGLLMYKSKNPAGPWDEVTVVHSVARWEDPCPFWDDDGKAYLVHSLLGACPLILHQMNPEGTKLLDEGKEIHRGSGTEGPKMFKRNGYYYISSPEHGVSDGCQVVLRSKNIYGPYERREVLPDGSPHQGGLVELKSGESWFIGFKYSGHLGRICHLEPVFWGADDWPVFGDKGRPVLNWKKPDVGKTFPIQKPQTNDEFEESSLSLIWQWNHNPVNTHWSLTDHPGFLRLKSMPANSIKEARNTLTQRIWDDYGYIEVKMDAAGMTQNQKAGILFLSSENFFEIGVVKKNDTFFLAYPNSKEEIILKTSGPVWFKGIYEGNIARLYYSTDGKKYHETKEHYYLSFGYWKGARVGIFCYGSGSGYSDFDYFHYCYSSNRKGIEKYL
jgi:beta-xylosidase